MLFLLTDSPQKLKSENIHDIHQNPLLFLSEVSSATKIFLFLLKQTIKQKTSTAAVDPGI